MNELPKIHLPSDELMLIEDIDQLPAEILDELDEGHGGETT